jgi:hypothetical protein
MRNLVVAFSSLSAFLSLCISMLLSYQEGHKEVCNVLLQAGAKVDVRDKAKKTVLHMLGEPNSEEWAKNDEILQLLKAAGAEVDKM